MSPKKVKKIPLVCLECGKLFEVYPYRYKRGNVKFCSVGCGTRYRNKTNNPAKRPEVRAKISANHADVRGSRNPMYGRRGPLAPGYIDGRNSIAGDTYRRLAILYLEHKCALCDETNLDNLDVHHKDGNRKNNELSNLIFLCKRCHLTKAHKYKRDRWGRFVSAKINEEVVL